MDRVTIETRPRLRCCNVFVRLRSGANSPAGVRVELSRDTIGLRAGDRSYDLSLGAVRIIPTSLSCLKVAGHWLSFRIQTAPVDSLYGSFVAELVGTSGLKSKSSSSTGSLEIPKDVALVFSCSCCENHLTKEVEFKKVLPLPDNDCDPADFFCCSHNGEDYSQLLEPRACDYLYGPHYALMSRQNFCEDLRITDESVVCSRCLAVVGVPNSAHSLKVWNCCVEFARCDQASKQRTDPLTDFKAVVRSCAGGFAHEGILLETKEAGVTRCLLLRPMEWNLDLLVEPDDLEPSQTNVSLSVKRVVKVLYDYGEAESSLNGDSKEDAKIIRVGLKCMLAGIEHLLLSSERMPPDYRNVDGHHIGYISLDVADKSLNPLK